MFFLPFYNVIVFETLDICDGMIYCTDATDEVGYQCEEDEFTCDCITKRTCSKPDGCVSNKAIRDGFIYCPGGGPNNRMLYHRIPFGDFGRIYVFKLKNSSDCESIGLPQCDSSSCYSTNISTCRGSVCSISQAEICTSYCAEEQNCNSAFQCADSSLILHSQFFDDIVDSADGSDEITNQPGFKCNNCVLPQNNLHDDLAHCNDDSDLCFADKNLCFQGLDKRLVISMKQVCDGVNDCFDLSD